MSRGVEKSRDARRDLFEIYEFITTRRHEREAGRRLIRDKAEAYARRPGMVTPHDEIELLGEAGPVRSFRAKNHLAFSVDAATDVIVFRRAHGRDVPSLLSL